MSRTSKSFMGLFLAVTLLATACGDDGGGDADDATSGTAPDGEALTPITIGVLPLADHAPLFYGIEQGFFAEEGLDVTTEAGTGGASMTPAVLQDELQFAAGNYLSLMLARQENVGIQVVSHFVSGSDTPGQTTTGLLVNQDSGIESVEDLAGKTIAVNALENIGEIVIGTVLREHGVDESSVEPVEVPFHEMNGALEAGQVDAALQAEPFITFGAAQGLVSLLDPMYETTPSLPIGMVFASETWLEDNAESANAFYRAFQRSLDASSNEQAMRDTMTDITDTPPDIIDMLPLANWQTEADQNALDRVVDLAVSYGILPEEPDLDQVFWDPGHK